MYKIDKKYGNLNRKTFIDSNFEHLLASNFTESLFLMCSNGYKFLLKSLSCPTYASAAPVTNASTDNQYRTSTGRTVQNIVIIPDICQHCARRKFFIGWINGTASLNFTLICSCKITFLFILKYARHIHSSLFIII